MTLMLGKIEGRRRRGGAEDEMVEWHHKLDGQEFEADSGSWLWIGTPAVHGLQSIRHN